MAYTQNKLPAIRQEAFKNAREALGLSIQDLSQMSCFSVRQIEQIENGESNSFYGAHIKFTAAKKVAGLLKLSEENAFDYGEVNPTKKIETAKSEPSDIEVRDDVISPAPQSVLEEDSVQTKAVPEKSIPAPEPILMKPEALSSATDKTTNSQRKIFLLVAIAAALVFSIVNLRPLFSPKPVKEEIVVEEAVAPASPSADTDAKSAPASLEPAAVVAPVVAPVAATVSSECPSADTNVVAYKPDAPKKAGDMVYLQSKTAQSVCVTDASGKTQNKTLEPGVGVSIYGKPPLKVLTTGQATVDMFYQGVKVRLSNTVNKTILLEPAEIIQPITSTDSQLR